MLHRACTDMSSCKQEACIIRVVPMNIMLIRDMQTHNLVTHATYTVNTVDALSCVSP